MGGYDFAYGALTDDQLRFVKAVKLFGIKNLVSQRSNLSLGVSIHSRRTREDLDCFDIDPPKPILLSLSDERRAVDGTQLLQFFMLQ